MLRSKAVSALAATLVAGCASSAGGPAVPGSPAHAIAHVVILLQENRSFDNLFAGFPGADTAMRGPCKPGPAWCEDGHDVPLKPIPLAEGSSRFGGLDICHSHQCFALECDADAAKVCRNDGFDLIDFGESQGGQAAKLYPYSYVRHSDVAAYWNLAKQYALADKMFFTETAASFVAHQTILSGTARLNDRESLTDQPDGMPWGCDAPLGTATAVIFKDGRVSEFGGPFPCFTQYRTLADLLDGAHVSWRYYVDSFKTSYPDLSSFAWNGFDAIKRVRFSADWRRDVRSPNTTILADVKDGTLPAVSWVVPILNDSDHPASGCNGGPRWVTKIVNAIGTSQYWKNTAIVLLWDDWGGWYDNVPPPQISYTRLGFRVPMIVISPFAKRHTVSHTQYTFGSMLKFVEETLGLGSLGTSDASSNSISDIFDFGQPPIAFAPAPLPRARGCAGSTTDSASRIVKQDGGLPD